MATADLGGGERHDRSGNSGICEILGLDFRRNVRHHCGFRLASEANEAPHAVRVVELVPLGVIGEGQVPGGLERNHLRLLR